MEQGKLGGTLIERSVNVLNETKKLFDAGTDTAESFDRLMRALSGNTKDETANSTE